MRVMACVAKGGGRATIRQQRKSCGEHEQNDETREIKLTNLGLQSWRRENPRLVNNHPHKS